MSSTTSNSDSNSKALKKVVSGQCRVCLKQATFMCSACGSQYQYCTRACQQHDVCYLIVKNIPN